MVLPTSTPSANQPLDLDLEIVPRQMFGKVRARQFVGIAIAAAHHHDFDRVAALEEWQRIRNGARRIAAPVPAYHDAVELERPLLDVRHHHDRTAGFEQRGFDHQIVRPDALGIRLARHHKVEMPGDAGEPIRRSAEARLHNSVLGGQTLALDGGFKARNRGLGGGPVFGALGIDPDGGKSVHDGRGDHRVERERNAGDMCAKRLRNRHGKGRRRIVALAERQTYHEILDHGPVSPRVAGSAGP